MSITQFRHNPSRAGGAVDKDAGVIYGVNVMEAGPTSDGRFEIDDVTLDQLVELGNAAGDGGVKSRFGHPGIFDIGTLGTYLGRMRNFRHDGQRVRADLYLSEAASKSPRGNLRDYVLEMAASESDMFGLSVAVELAHQQEWRMKKDSPPLLRIARLEAVDAVEQGAATKALFNEDEKASPGLVRRAIEFLESQLRSSDSGVEPEAGGAPNNEGPIMDLEKTTLEALKASRPDLASALLEEGKAQVDVAKLQAEAKAAERGRILAILKHAQPVHFNRSEAQPHGLAFALLESDKSDLDIMGDLMAAALGAKTGEATETVAELEATTKATKIAPVETTPASVDTPDRAHLKKARYEQLLRDGKTEKQAQMAVDRLFPDYAPVNGATEGE